MKVLVLFTLFLFSCQHAIAAECEVLSACEISKAARIQDVPNTGKLIHFSEFLSALQGIDETIPLKSRAYATEGFSLGMISGGLAGFCYGGKYYALGGAIGCGLLGAFIGDSCHQSLCTVAFTEQYKGLDEDERELLLECYNIASSQAEATYQSEVALCLTPSPSNSQFMTSIQLYNFSGAHGTPWENVKVYRRSMLNAVKLAGNLETMDIDAKGFSDRMNEGLGGNFWRGVTQPFTYITGKKNSQKGKEKPVVVAMCSNGYDQILVAFYGTSGGKDWLSNIKVPSKSVPYGGQAHMGFVDAADSCKDIMIQKIKSLVPTGKDLSSVQVICVGHSLGGAVSVLSGLHMIEAFAAVKNKKLGKETNSQNNVAIITMGQPRVWRGGHYTPVSGGFTHAKEYEGLIKRVNLLRLVSSKTGKESSDIVTHIPPEFFEYEHIGYLRRVVMATKTAKKWLAAFHDLTIYDHAVMNDTNIGGSIP